MRNLIWIRLVPRCEKICSSLYFFCLSSSSNYRREVFHQVLRVVNLKPGFIVVEHHVPDICSRSRCSEEFLWRRPFGFNWRYGVIDVCLSHRHSLLNTLLLLLAVGVLLFCNTIACEAHKSFACFAVLQFKVWCLSLFTRCINQLLFRLACLERTMVLVLVYPLFSSVCFTGTATVCFLSEVTFHAESTVPSFIVP